MIKRWLNWWRELAIDLLTGVVFMAIFLSCVFIAGLIDYSIIKLMEDLL